MSHLHEGASNCPECNPPAGHITDPQAKRIAAGILALPPEAYLWPPADDAPHRNPASPPEAATLTPAP